MDIEEIKLDVDPDNLVTRTFSSEELEPVIEQLDKQFMQLVTLHFAGTNADADTTYTFAMSVLIIWISKIFMEDKESALVNAQLFASQLLEQVHKKIHETP